MRQRIPFFVVDHLFNVIYLARCSTTFCYVSQAWKMPLRTRVGENARTAYIEEKFAQEARRRNYDVNALLQKPKKNERRKF